MIIGVTFQIPGLFTTILRIKNRMTFLSEILEKNKTWENGDMTLAHWAIELEKPRWWRKYWRATFSTIAEENSKYEYIGRGEGETYFDDIPPYPSPLTTGIHKKWNQSPPSSLITIIVVIENCSRTLAEVSSYILRSFPRCFHFDIRIDNSCDLTSVFKRNSERVREWERKRRKNTLVAVEYYKVGILDSIPVD